MEHKRLLSGGVLALCAVFAALALFRRAGARRKGRLLGAVLLAAGRDGRRGRNRSALHRGRRRGRGRGEEARAFGIALRLLARDSGDGSMARRVDLRLYSLRRDGSRPRRDMSRRRAIRSPRPAAKRSQARAASHSARPRCRSRERSRRISTSAAGARSSSLNSRCPYRRSVCADTPR